MKQQKDILSVMEEVDPLCATLEGTLIIMLDSIKP